MLKKRLLLVLTLGLSFSSPALAAHEEFTDRSPASAGTSQPWVFGAPVVKDARPGVMAVSDHRDGRGVYCQNQVGKSRTEFDNKGAPVARPIHSSGAGAGT